MEEIEQWTSDSFRNKKTRLLYRTTMTSETPARSQEAMTLLYEISLLLNSGLDKETLAICVSLLETGVNPEALAAVVKELKPKTSKDGPPPSFKSS